MDNLVNVNQDLSTRVIKDPIFNNHTKILKLADPVVLYNNGVNWKCVPLKTFLIYPVIHDLYEGDKRITVYVCPYTLFSCVYFEQFFPGNQVYNNNLTLTNKDNILIPILGNLYNRDTMNLVDNYIRKGEVKIMTLRNAISTFPDILFFELENIATNLMVPLVDADYSKNKIIKFDNAKFSDKYHPKQIIYVIEYHSKKQSEYKYTVIIPKNGNLDIKKNKFGDYFNKMINKIRDKGGHIYTCYWFAWESTHTNFKEIEI